MLNPRHILITGASSGIGAALADIYAAPGFCLSLHGRNPERLAKVAEQAKQKGAIVYFMAGDITDSQNLIGWIKTCDARQPIDLIIANAGISAGTSGLDNNDVQTRNIFAVNLFGVLDTVQAVLPSMIQRRCGQVAIMSSLASFRGFAGASTYCASKAAVRTYGEALRSEMTSHGVEVNVICPGFIKTPLTDTNAFRMPFLMSAPQAAKRIVNGLARNQARIAFPWIMYALVRLLAIMPQNWIDCLTRRLPKKGD